MAGKPFTPQGFARNYLSFSRSQRRAIFWMGLMALGVLVVAKAKQFFYPRPAPEPFVAVEVTQTLKVRQSQQNQGYRKYPPDQHESRYTPQPQRTGNNLKNRTAINSANLTAFDPNTVSTEQLQSFGLSRNAALNIIRFREKGGRFRTPDDLKKMYRLLPEEAAALMPYVTIKAESRSVSAQENRQSSETFSSALASSNHKPKTSRAFTVDVNEADSLTLTLLPGIGAKRASDILKYRNRLGGFVTVDQVGETFGLPDSVFSRIKPNLLCKTANLQQIPLNTCTEKQLKSHPYISWQLARIIIAYRNQHGPFKQVDDLLKIHTVQEEWLEKVRPYLNAGDGGNTVVQN